MKSEEYIKDRDQKLKEKTADVERLTEEFSSFDVRLSSVKKEREELKKNVKELKKELKELTEISRKQDAVIRDYEERYKGIDIGKMHEEIEMLKTNMHSYKVGEAAAKNDLYKVRDRMMTMAKVYDE